MTGGSGRPSPQGKRPGLLAVKAEIFRFWKESDHQSFPGPRAPDSHAEGPGPTGRQGAPAIFNGSRGPGASTRTGNTSRGGGSSSTNQQRALMAWVTFTGPQAQRSRKTSPVGTSSARSSSVAPSPSKQWLTTREFCIEGRPPPLGAQTSGTRNIDGPV